MADESVSVYWGHYITEREEAIRDFDARSADAPQKFYVTVTETFRLIIEIETDSRQKAEQIVSADWRKRAFTLDPEDFAGVEFEVEPATEQRKEFKCAVRVYLNGTAQRKNVPIGSKSAIWHMSSAEAALLGRFMSIIC